ncbi:MAG TPA: Crp/Fnr family transcriptional regulator [Patescibacteria group bacterium]|nr:Crp/Fnr family transcriptional regulator [Patescibacteria group bacterium]
MQDRGNKLYSFFSQYRTLDYKKGQIILRSDDNPSGIYYVRRGYVRLYSISESGQELTLIIVKPHDIFPIRWAITGQRHRYYFEAMTPVELSKAPLEDFSDFIHMNPEALYEILNNVLSRLGGLLERMEYSVFGNAYQKVASILVICAERFGIQKGKSITIRVPMTHSDIANLIGLTRETASVELKKLEKIGVCEKDGRFFMVKNLDKLKTEANWSKFA